MSMLATIPRPAPASAWAATSTLGWRAMLKIKHVPFQLFDVTAFPLMMTLMFNPATRTAIVLTGESQTPLVATVAVPPTHPTATP